MKQISIIIALQKSATHNSTTLCSPLVNGTVDELRALLTCPCVGDGLGQTTQGERGHPSLVHRLHHLPGDEVRHLITQLHQT